MDIYNAVLLLVNTSIVLLMLTQHHVSGQLVGNRGVVQLPSGFEYRLERSLLLYSPNTFCQALVPSPVPLDPNSNPKQSQIQVQSQLVLGWLHNHIGLPSPNALIELWQGGQLDRGHEVVPCGLVLHTLILSWIEPNQRQNTSQWAWHCWTQV